MTVWTWIWRSLCFHWRSHVGVLAGAGVGSAVLVGALAVGDSVRASLHRMAMLRLGRVELAMSSGERLFRAELAGSVQSKLGARVVAALDLPGSASAAGGSARANQVRVLGVDARFWELAERNPGLGELPSDAVVLNDALARQLGLRPDLEAGEAEDASASAGKLQQGSDALSGSILLRVLRPTSLSRDAPLAPEEDTAEVLRLRVHRVIPDEELGRFGLRASQVPPFNAFVSLEALQQKLQTPGRANLLLVAGGESAPGGKAATFEVATGVLREAWRLADAELDLRELPGREALELRTPRVFLDSPVAAAALGVATNSSGILTYLVNELRVGDRITPYSMVTAMGTPVVPQGMADDEILISMWLAEDLQARPGDEITLTYYVVGLGRALEEQSARFRVRGVLPVDGPWRDPSLMPDFPGLTDADNCRDWDAGFPLDTSKIRDQDEAYWDTHRGTPKAFITLAAGQQLWGNRFGDFTAVRYPAAPDPSAMRSRIERALLESIDPAQVGLRFEPVREQARAAAAGATDFGGLFIGFSFFLVVAAVLLMALLYQFGIEQRAEEVGTLLAVGFPPRLVRRLFLFEGAVLALVGGALGLVAGTGYARAMLHGLATIWREAVGTSSLTYSASGSTLATGACAGFLVAWIAIGWSLRRHAGQPARRLLAEGAGAIQDHSRTRGGARSMAGWLAGGSALAAVVLILVALGGGETASSATFFGAGALLLACGLALSFQGLNWLARTQTAGRLSLSQLGVRNTARRRRRSLSTLGLLACGSFLVASIGVFRLESVQGAQRRASGTGGFALLGETTLPVVQDLNSKRGRDFYALNEQTLAGVSFVSFRVREGDDASCLNLNRAQKPRLLGVDPARLAQRHAFTFAQVAKGLPADDPWMLLRRASGDAVPAIGDMSSIIWAMGKRVGDTLAYTDERGREFRVRIVAAVANSVLQGNLVIDEQAFIRLYPSEAGYRRFFIDAPFEGMDAVAGELGRGLRDAGLELVPATRRLAQFNAVQNTYLGTFQVLGGLGLLLGSVGLGVLVLRNVLERRPELALMLAVGFRARSLKHLIVSEHGALLVVGLGVGLVAAGVAVLPSILGPGGRLPAASLALTLGAVLLSGVIWTWGATVVALRGHLLTALRNE